MNLFSRDELGLLLHDEEGIPPDASLLPFKFVAIPCMKKSVENGTIIKIDIAKIGYTVEDQLHAQIYIEYTVHGNIIIFEKSYITTFLETKDVIRLPHPPVEYHEGKEYVGFNRALIQRLVDNTPISRFIMHKYVRNYTT